MKRVGVLLVPLALVGAIGYGTGSDGRFSLPVNRGVNRLEITCESGHTGSTTMLVVRGRESGQAVTLDRP